MDQKLRVTSIVLTTANGMRVELTIPEARELYDQLTEMFGKTPVNTPVIIDRHHWPMPWRPYQPMWVSDQTGDATPNPCRIVCSAPSGLHTEFHGVSWNT
ncbi:MAG TPA: hypothetical protein P5317_12465 [Myxococcota bacterium]|jgi:hypothetical protein|nr:hypothetical protein [Myxococcota bacterium]